MRTVLALVLVLAGCSGTPLRPPRQGDALAIAGAADGRRYGYSAAELAALPRRTVRGAEPRSGREAAFAGAALAPFLTEKVPLRPGTDVAIFRGRGGYQAAVPLNAIRQSGPVLATQADGKPLEDGLPGAGPLLLAWPDAEAPGLDSDPRQRWFWVRDVTLVELGSWQEGLGRALRAPAGAGDDARHGSDTFGSQCIHCHRVRGRGGEVGPELTALPAAADPARLAEALRGHLSRKSGIRGVPDPGPQEVRELAAFLRAVAIAGPDEARPEVPLREQPPPPRPPPGPRRP